MIKPTRWPLLQFSLTIWKLHIYTGIMHDSIDAQDFEYVTLNCLWGAKWVFNFKLYDTYRRIDAKLK